MSPRLAQLLFALWIGAVLAVSFVVAPVVFSKLAAGEAGPFLRPIFKTVDAFGIAAAAMYLLLLTARGSRRRRITMTLGACALANLFVLAPKIAARDEPFALWHGLSTGLWMVILIGGVFLLVGDARRSVNAATAASDRPG
ncbi:MAG: DUF4149 domain-containing protein [Planctomycetota bacterium]